jgi:hypothetical protein
MRRFLILTVACLLPVAPAFGQGGIGGPTPLAVDLKKVPVGSWAEYKVSIGAGGGMTMTSRWALVARDSNSNTMEMAAEGGPMARAGGKMVVKTVLVPDPTTAERPVKSMVMKVGDHEPMEMPLDMPNMPPQRFEKPDPKKLVGKEQVKVPAGTFKASHYRDVTETGTVDAWISDEVPPLGMVKVTVNPKPGATGPQGQPIPPVTMELTAKGKDAKPTITKGGKPFDPSVFSRPAPAPKGEAPKGEGKPAEKKY